MANQSFRLFIVLCLAVVALAMMPYEGSLGFQDTEYGSTSWQEFARLEAANQAIDLQNPDYELLNAAVFFATNRAREQKRLAQLTFVPALRNMAHYHAEQMAKYQFVAHENPHSPRYATVEARGRQFDAQVNAENVASSFLHQYESGTRYYTRKTDQGYLYFDAAQSRPIVLHTYWSFAQSIVQGWIESPPHRKNLYHPELKTLGCACAIEDAALNPGQLPMAYCGQNFGIESAR